jgi:hypothetical protein
MGTRGGKIIALSTGRRDPTHLKHFDFLKVAQFAALLQNVGFERTIESQIHLPHESTNKEHTSIRHSYRRLTWLKHVLENHNARSLRVLFRKAPRQGPTKQQSEMHDRQRSKTRTFAVAE